MLRKIRKWEKILKLPPQKCSQKQDEHCHAHSKLWFKLQDQIKGLKEQLSLLPDFNTFKNEFLRKKFQLEQMGYLENNIVNPRGELARHIYIQEIFVTELIYSGILNGLDDDQLAALISCIDYENKRNDFFCKEDIINFRPVKELINYIHIVCGPESVRFDPRVAVITYFWSKGFTFKDIQQLCNLDEGDIIAVFRRTIDLLRQMREAVNDNLLRERLNNCMKKLDRDEASIMDI